MQTQKTMPMEEDMAVLMNIAAVYIRELKKWRRRRHGKNKGSYWK